MLPREQKKLKIIQVQSSGEVFSKASLTVEASLVLPLFLFCMVLLIMPMRIMNVSRKMQGVCEEICEDVCKYAYTISRLEEGFEIDDKDGAAVFLDLTVSGALGAYASKKAEDAAKDDNLSVINFLNTECMVTDDMVTIRLDYEYRMPFSVLGIPPVLQQTVASGRAWVGAKPEEGEGEETEDEDTYVYVGKSSERYHLSPSCHYLSNEFTAVGISGIPSLRNQSGHSYSPCGRCGKNAQPGQPVYILKNGTSYHTDMECTAINAYVKKVKKKTVEHLGPCSYCGGK